LASAKVIYNAKQIVWRIYIQQLVSGALQSGLFYWKNKKAAVCKIHDN
jgi:hypothetical protein